MNKDVMMLVVNTCFTPTKTVVLPLSNVGNGGVVVDWGDGSVDVIHDSGAARHLYNNDGVYCVSITGNLIAFGDKHPRGSFSNRDLVVSDIGIYTYKKARDSETFGEFSSVGEPFFGKSISPYPPAITNVIHWGLPSLKSLSNAFYGNVNLKTVPIYLPDNVTDLSGMFWMADKFNGNISAWDTSGVTNMEHMFDTAVRFNCNIGSWDVSSVENMYKMFNYASSFNQDISRWDISNVKDVSKMFYKAISFNQDISNWDVNKVKKKYWMLSGATSFDQPNVSWDTSMFNKKK